MKFTTTVGARTLSNLEELLRAFYCEGGRESKLEVKGMDVTMEVDFRQIPKKIIKAMNFCKIKKFSYNNDARLDSLVGATMKVQLLKENLGEANKTKLICGFFNEFDPDSSLVISNGEAIISKFIHPSIAIIKEAGLQYAFNLSKVKEDFDKPEQEIAKKEKSGHLQQDDVEEKSSAEPELKEAEEKNTEIGVVTPNTGKVKMQCMPEIHGFEEILKSIDKAQTAEEISKHILKGMGLIENGSREQQYLIRIVSTALETDMSDFNSVYEENTSENRKALFDRICAKAGLSEKVYLFAQLNLSKFINNYVKIYYPDSEVILSFDFLRELKEVVMS